MNQVAHGDGDRCGSDEWGRELRSRWRHRYRHRPAPNSPQNAVTWFVGTSEAPKCVGNIKKVRRAAAGHDDAAF